MHEKPNQEILYQTTFQSGLILNGLNIADFQVRLHGANQQANHSMIKYST